MEGLVIRPVYAKFTSLFLIVYVFDSQMQKAQRDEKKIRVAYFLIFTMHHSLSSEILAALKYPGF